MSINCSHLREIKILKILTTPSAVIAATSLALLSLLVWSSIANVEIVVSGEAIAEVEGGTEVLRSATPGKVSRVLVKEGEAVESGQILVILENKDAISQKAAVEEDLNQSAKRLAEVSELLQYLESPNSHYIANPSIASRFSEYTNRIENYEWRLATIGTELTRFQDTSKFVKSMLNNARKQVQGSSIAYAKGAISKSELNQSREIYSRHTIEYISHTNAIKKTSEERLALISERNGYRSQFKLRLLEEHSSLGVEVARLSAERDLSETQTINHEIRATSSAFVSTLSVGEGEFIDRGQEIATLLPTSKPMVFKTKILTSQIAFLGTSPSCRIKLDALPFTRYGSVDCRLMNISKDAVLKRGSEPYYVAIVLPISEHIQIGDHRFQIVSGTSATVDLVTSERTVLSFITDPLQRFRLESMRER